MSDWSYLKPVADSSSSETTVLSISGQLGSRLSDRAFTHNHPRYAINDTVWPSTVPGGKPVFIPGGTKYGGSYYHTLLAY